MLRQYPIIRDEFETMKRVLAGASIARYGDGEFKLCRDGRAIAQPFHPTLCERLRAILADSGSCMVGIPNLHSDTPKKSFWNKFRECAFYLEARPYASAFITRPDSAPWINTPEYWQQLETLWAGQDVTIVRGSTKGLTADDLTSARVVTEVICPRQDAYAEYDRILQRVGKPRRALICLGPTATVLAVDLCARGVHAIDLGHVAIFLRKYRRGEPMVLTKDDKSHDKKAIPVT